MALTNDISDLDRKVRLTAFKWLAEQVALHGDVLPRSILSAGLEFENQHVPLVSPQGIFQGIGVRPTRLTIRKPALQKFRPGYDLFQNLHEC